MSWSTASSLTEEADEADIEASEAEDFSVFEDDFNQKVVATPSSKSCQRPTFLNTTYESRPTLSRSKSVSVGFQDPEREFPSPAASEGGSVTPKNSMPKISDTKKVFKTL